MRDTVMYNRNCKNANQSGYTLVEIAIVLIVLGIFAGSFLHIYSLYQEQSKIDDTALDRTRIVRALDNFKTRTGRYPCPASYTDKRTDPQYGREGDCTDTSVTPGSCTNGYCVELSERQVTLDDGSTVTPRVRRGSLPFRDLYLDEDESYDSYGGRFSYAVTELLTDWKTYSVSRGGISIVDNNEPAPGSVVEPVGSALYFVFSHGKDGVGAYDHDGNQMIPCTGPMIDNENCNTSVNGNQKLAIYRSSTQSDVPISLIGVTAPLPPGAPPIVVNSNMHYDDVAAFMGNEEEPIWKNSDVPGSGIVHDTLLPSENIVVGGTATDQKLNVGGSVKVSGNVKSTTICDKNGANCFESYLIGGSGMACPNSSDVGTGVANKNIICANPATLNVSCPSGQFIMGFDPVTGAPICSAIVLPQPCAASSRNICGTSKPLPASPHGTTITLTGGASRVQPYLCNNGTWQAQTASGVCNCTPGSVTSAPVACGTGYTGTYTTTTTTSCPSGTVTTTNTFGSTCTCAGYTQTGTRSCTAPWSGTQTRTRPYTCVGNTPTAGAWTAWGPACTCPPQAPRVNTVACQPNYTGSATQTQTLDTTTCTWISGPIDYSGCSCNPQTQTRAGTCPANQTGTTTEQRTLNCPAGTWSPWTQVSSSCSCVDKTVTQNVGCPTGQVGAHVQQQLQDCNGTPKGPWTDVSNTCAAPPPKKWVAMSKGVGTVSSAPYGTKEGDICSTPGMGTCFVSVGGGQFDRYSCSCE